jgi:Skp family chaperone for outer membrane proteins
MENNDLAINFLKSGIEYHTNLIKEIENRKSIAKEGPAGGMMNMDVIKNAINDMNNEINFHQEQIKEISKDIEKLQSNVKTDGGRRISRRRKRRKNSKRSKKSRKNCRKSHRCR